DAPHVEVEAALRGAVDEHLPRLLPWLPVLAIPFGLELAPTHESERLDERFLRERLAELTAELLMTLLRDRAALILVEDVQHIDEASTDLLRSLQAGANGSGDRAWTLFVTGDDPVPTFAPEEETAAGEASWFAMSLLPLPLRQAQEVVETLTE